MEISLLGSERARAGNRPGYSPMALGCGAALSSCLLCGVATDEVSETQPVQVRKTPFRITRPCPGGGIVNLSRCQPDFADEDEYEWLPRPPVPS